MARKAYSRLASVEERKNKKKAAVFIVLTVAASIFIFFWGIPTLIKFASFVSDLTRGQKPIEKVDTTPPAPPQIDTLPDFTNQKTVTITGRSESGATVTFYLNGKEKQLLIDKNGTFSFDFNLIDGENSISAIAKDVAGNESQKTKVYKVVFDDTPPALEINKPNESDTFYGNSQRQIVIQGTTEAGAVVNINDRLVAVDAEGQFEYATSLNEGENKFNIKATDSAGNATEKSIVVTYSQ